MKNKISVQVLVAAVNADEKTLLKKMNIQTDAIVGNQCSVNEIKQFTYNKNNIKWLSFNERGVGLNRNNTLMRASSDVVLFADDDMVYVDNYEKIIQDEFEMHPDIDVLIFNLKEQIPTRYIIKKKTKINHFNYLRYGTARIAVRLDKIKKNAIYFNQCFGGGTEHCHGEDNIFLSACLKKKLKILAIPKYIAELSEERESSWNKGYNEKYLSDQGYLYSIISPKWWKLLCLQDVIRHRNKYKNIGKWYFNYKLMINKKA